MRSNLRIGLKDVNVLYRRVGNHEQLRAGFNLSEALNLALDTVEEGEALRDNWSRREISLDTSDSVVLSYVEGQSNEIFGEVTLLEKGGFFVSAKVEQEGQSVLDIAHIPTGDGDAPCNGMGFFYARDNHLLYVDLGISTSKLERLLDWLLAKQDSGGVPIHVSLTGKLTGGAAKAAQLDATELEIRPAPVLPPTPMEGVISEKAGTQATADHGKVVEILKIIGMGYDRWGDFISQTDGEGRIELSVSLKLKRRRRLEPVRAIPLEMIAKNFDEDELVLRGKNGSQVGSVTTLKFPTRVRRSNSIVERESAKEACYQAWCSFVDRGLV